MGELKSLAKDTVIYGASSILGKCLNYLLVPIYTNYISAASGDYGVMTNIYSLVALLLVFLTFGMETGFFRFANKEGYDAKAVYSSAMYFVLFLSITFFLLSWIFIDDISRIMRYEEKSHFLLIMFAVVAIDAIQSLPFAYLRYKKKAIKFASLKLLFIFISISMNICYFMFMGGKDIGVVFIINLATTLIINLGLITEFREINLRVDFSIIKELISYSWPMLILGVAGILNQVADKIIFPYVYPDKELASVHLGIYGAVSKVAMIMAMFTQAFRFAYEPIVFGKSNDKNNKEVYAKAMKYFVIFALLAFLVVMLYMDILSHIIGKEYREGLVVVPIIMIAELFMGIYFNLSFWYKLTDRTIWGAVFSLTACVVVIALNIILVPRYGYVACAVASLVGYGIAMTLSYIVGQRYYPIKYDIKSLILYSLLSGSILAIHYMVRIDSLIFNIAISTLLISIYIFVIIYRDLPLRELPIINKIIKRKQHE